MKLHCLVATASIITGATVAKASEVVYSQPQQGGTAAGISLTQGGNQFAFADRRRADNFTLTAESAIESVRFWGGTESDFFGASNISNISSFNIRFYSDTGGLPGGIIAEYTASLAATNPVIIPGQSVGFLNASMYQFEITLTSAVGLDPGTQYWISVAASVSQPVGLNAEGWQWASSGSGDGVIAQDNFNGDGFFVNTNVQRDAAFELVGTVIPNPGTLGLLTIAGLMANRRRR